MEHLKDMARTLRKDVLELSYKTGSGHIGSCFSTLDLLTGLYFNFLRVDPLNPEDPLRDRFILSKGHASAALYCTLAKRNFLSDDTLQAFAVDGGTLRHHPDRCLKYGIEASTGSLGHGLGLAAGLAYSAKLSGQSWRTVALMSDGELNEGTVWEAAMFAGHHKLDSLVAVVDLNKIQALGHTRDIISFADLASTWRGLGWAVKEIDGHDMDQIVSTLDSLPFQAGQPSVILADTIKGRGVSFMEDQLLWHYRCPDTEEFLAARKELLES